MSQIAAIVAKIGTSSTWWVSILLPVLKVLLDKVGINIPWEVVCAGQGSYAIKEAATKVAPLVKKD